MVKVPSLNLEPDQTARMRLWSNIIRFCKDRFCVVAQVTSPVFLLSNTKAKIARIVACIEIAFPDTYAALSEPELFAPVIYYLLFASFCKKKFLVRLHMLIWFFKCNNRIFVPWLD